MVMMAAAGCSCGGFVSCLLSLNRGIEKVEVEHWSVQVWVEKKELPKFCSDAAEAEHCQETLHVVREDVPWPVQREPQVV